MLDIAPEIENTVRSRAMREGVSVNELLTRMFQTGLLNTMQSWRAPVVISGDEQRAAVHALLGLSREEAIRRNAASIASLQAKLEAAANATPEEIAAADAEWEEYKRNMNANRAITGEQPVYTDVSAPTGKC